tara:strand:- start:12408 stop:12908 length:501 start_codon:yes stop_codon:yes gene_type:complete
MINLKFSENKKIYLKKENFYLIIFIFFLFSLDRLTKVLILDNFTDNTYYFNDFLNLDLVWNTGIGFGLLTTSNNLVYNVTSLMIALVIGFLIYIGLKSETSEKIIFSVIIGGAIGNFYDRIVFKGVPDFIDLHYGNFHWFTFNVADIFITVGILIYILKGFFTKNE